MADHYQGQPPRHQHQPGYGQPMGGPHETYIVQAPTPARDTSVNRITVPLLMVGTLGAALVSGTYMATSGFTDIKHSIDKLSGRIETLTGELSSRITRLEQDAQEKQREAWTKRDHDLWCAKAERANQTNGWTCGDASRVFAPQVNGWAATARKP